MDGSYAAGGKYHAQIAKNLQPSFATAAGPVMNLNVFVLVSMLATAHPGHYNLSPTATFRPQQPLAHNNLSPTTTFAYSAHCACWLTVLTALTLPYHTYQAFLAHYNAPKFFKELAGPEDGSSKLPRFNQVLTVVRSQHSPHIVGTRSTGL